MGLRPTDRPTGGDGGLSAPCGLVTGIEGDSVAEEKGVATIEGHKASELAQAYTVRRDLKDLKVGESPINPKCRSNIPTKLIFSKNADLA